ncbi:hypothetical protein ACFBZI_07790 [Moraxella sp. ZJ142]|uniref:hypothetical protein n=1 Tax=Moraxella marmotae TaxID=3344520 RepID=UPI0035D46C03
MTISNHDLPKLANFDALKTLKTNRHALSQTDNTALIAKILSSFYRQPIDDQSVGANDPNTWYLIGTDGCHLCDKSHAVIKQAFATTSNAPTLQLLDLANASDEQLIDALGVLIPVLITKTRLLCYPFGVMDILSLLHDV